MSKKIINIIIFVIAGIGCLLTLWFALSFDDNKKDLYYEIETIKNSNEQVLIDFQEITPENLNAFTESIQTESIRISNELKENQLQRDILYTFIVQLQDLNEEEAFLNYKSGFERSARILFNKSDKKENYISGFNNVSGFNTLPAFITRLEDEYSGVKQNYLVEKDYVRAYNNFLKRVQEINSILSDTRKSADLASLQASVKSVTSEERILNFAVLFTYIVFIIAIGLVILFSLYQVIRSIKTSYKALLAVMGMVLIMIIGYFIGSPELSKSAISMGMTPGEVKWIDAGIYTFYVVFIGAIISIIISPLINKIKKI